jgi:hypothetical protein
VGITQHLVGVDRWPVFLPCAQKATMRSDSPCHRRGSPHLSGATWWPGPHASTACFIRPTNLVARAPLGSLARLDTTPNPALAAPAADHSFALFPDLTMLALWFTHAYTHTHPCMEKSITSAALHTYVLASWIRTSPADSRSYEEEAANGCREAPLSQVQSCLVTRQGDRCTPAKLISIARLAVAREIASAP